MSNVQVSQFELNPEDSVTENYLKGKSINNINVDDLVNSISYIYVDMLTICVIQLKNGFQSVGESHVMDRDNYSREIGMEVSFNNACSKINDHEVYQLFKDSYTG